MFEVLGWLVFIVVVVLGLAAVGVAVIGRRAGSDFSQQLRTIRGAFGRGATLRKAQPDATKAELYEAAKDAGIPGRSTMSKDELKAALDDE
jgi:hypothetical protein